MKCPVCEVDLTMAERQGVEIDYCSKCRGVWLDRGELDKIIERSSPAAAAPLQRPEPGRSPYGEERYRDEHHDHDHDKHGYGNKKRGGFLGNMFDF